jgi:hypothetical protein
VSWPIIIIMCGVSFGLGAFWHSKHAVGAERRAWRARQVRRSAPRVEVPYPLPVQRVLDHDTEYHYGRRGRETVARS